MLRFFFVGNLSGITVFLVQLCHLLKVPQIEGKRNKIIPTTQRQRAQDRSWIRLMLLGVPQWT